MGRWMNRARVTPTARRLVLLILGGLVVLILTFWAGRVTMSEPQGQSSISARPLDVEVVESELGRVLTLSTTVRQSSTALAVNELTGIVTRVLPSGLLNAGDVVYEVGESAVRLIPGSEPFWRDLNTGSQGADVEQVQQFLSDSGYQIAVDGTWNAATSSAFSQWQNDAGIPSDGTAPLGSLVAIGHSPIQVQIDSSLAWPGARLVGGERVLSVASGDPSFVMELSQNQLELVPSGTSVTVTAGETSWPGVTAEIVQTEMGYEASVTAPDGSLLCGQECGLLPPSSGTPTFLPTEVVISPPTTGPVVPVAAITTQPDGSTSVLRVASDGTVEQITVEIQAALQGFAVVSGVEVGDRVRVFEADDAATAESS